MLYEQYTEMLHDDAISMLSMGCVMHERAANDVLRESTVYRHRMRATRRQGQVGSSWSQMALQVRRLGSRIGRSEATMFCSHS